MHIRKELVVAALASTWMLWPAVADAQFGVERNLGYTFHLFSDVDGVDVYSHHASAGVDMSRNVSLLLRWTHDTVVIPALDAPPGSQDAVDAITTASRPISNAGDPYEDFVKVRDEVQGTLSFKGARASYYVSTESDWFAQMVTVAYNHGFMQDNLTLSGGVSYGWDDITPVVDIRTSNVPDYQTTRHANFVATQVLTPITVLRAGVEYNQIEGLQHDPYRNVYVDGGNVSESHPRDRDRYDVFVRLSQYLYNRSSIKVDYRYYGDDWGISSHTIGGKLHQYVTDNVVVRYRYRYYSQVPAFFWRDEYEFAGGVDGLQTGDYRLGDYGAHLFGGQVMWLPQGLADISVLERANLVFSYEHYFNSNNFSANVFETGLQVSF